MTEAKIKNLSQDGIHFCRPHAKKNKGRSFSCCSIPFAAMKMVDWIESVHVLSQCRGRILQKRDIPQKQQAARAKLVPSVAAKRTVGCPRTVPIKSPDPAPRAPAHSHLTCHSFSSTIFAAYNNPKNQATRTALLIPKHWTRSDCKH
jgi:hypothetical protein